MPAVILAAALILAEPGLAAEQAPITASHHRDGGWDRGWGDDDDRDRDDWRDGRGRWSDIAAFAANNGGPGFWVLTTDGDLFALQGAPQLGSANPRRRYVAMASHPTRQGFWLLAARGNVEAFGAARDHGSGRFNAAGMAVHRTGRGYWVVNRRGRVQAFGKARHHGDARRAGVRVDRIVARDDADGYYLRTTTGRWLQYPRPRRDPRRDQRTDRDRRTPKPPTTTQPPTSGRVRVTTVRGITVATSIARNVRRLMAAADRAGVRLGGWGYRSTARQIELRRAHCGTSRYAIYRMPSSRCNPPTARPGTSMHEKGLAIDFYKRGRNGRAISIGGTREFRWLKRNAHKYGLYNLPSEPWHWSTNGR